MLEPHMPDVLCFVFLKNVPSFLFAGFDSNWVAAPMLQSSLINTS
jgi:hypothetical protein